jgi:hypothetical protein
MPGILVIPNPAAPFADVGEGRTSSSFCAFDPSVLFPGQNERAEKPSSQLFHAC